MFRMPLPCVSPFWHGYPNQISGARANFKSKVSLVASLFSKQTDFIFCFFFFFFFIVNVKQTFISGAKPQDMLVETVARLLYRFLPTKWVGKGCSDPLTLPTSLPNSFGLRVSSISPPLSGHYCACPVINAFCERLHCRQLALGKSATRASQPD